MSDGRTVWLPKDAAWWRREYVVELGEEFGAEGPAVLDWLCCEAKAQNDGGTVKAGYRSVGRGCFVDVVTVGHVVSRAVQLGALDDFEGDDRRFTCRISGWASDQAKGFAAARKAGQRARETPVNTEDPPRGPKGTDRDKSRRVPPSPEMSPRGEESRENNYPPKPPQGGEVVTFERRPVTPDRLALARRLLDEFNGAASTDYGAFTAQGKPSESLKRIIGALTRSADVTFEDGAAAIRWRLANPFWEGKAHPGVVFGPGVFDQAQQSAAATVSADETRRRKLVGQ